MRIGITSTVLALALLQGGCAFEPVQPWEKDLLAKRAMQLDGYPIDQYLDDHIYYSKEGSSGGQAVGGGGCGCN
ncbi:DUF4266 domain-containing protein [Thiohalomonas denitrificans]|uniref:DUF4266 domain-containing protein n=1 Tax=Thiohalomonas denitrificans TaxID=415747 RepID=UPI0026F26EDE|nr:DUF4266 domain-containing protein [Thiohalomonas denitrificans]